MRITTAERALMTPGSCLRCGAYSVLDRNSAGRCTECHNLEYRERRAIMSANVEQQREAGRLYWQQRGIRVGQRVKTVAVNMFGTSAEVVQGVAKVGAVGAYVSSRFQRGYLQPDGWQAASQEANG